jgi:hypothetical protein
MDPAGNDSITRVLRWAGVNRGIVAEQVILVHDAGWLHDPEFIRECTVASLEDPERILEIDWHAVDALLARRPHTSTPALKALRTARTMAPAARRSVN